MTYTVKVKILNIEVHGHIVEFHKDFGDITSYIEHMEFYFVANEVNNTDKNRAILLCPSSYAQNQSESPGNYPLNVSELESRIDSTPAPDAAEQTSEIPKFKRSTQYSGLFSTRKVSFTHPCRSTENIYRWLACNLCIGDGAMFEAALNKRAYWIGAYRNAAADKAVRGLYDKDDKSD
ncbi:hypothetical protein LSH36_811g00053 [Paralvinella palmiformis]|uniref:Uncharacterized protein n=1 Tax=Paralvinella palmiformis TaxID=53620 RepID=A0AAD9J0H7_9ANNE|nr:hypothetical protein LSH36_811g00053 [Paralvinella palmiformis]